MKKIIISIALLVFSTLAFSQNDKKATTILNDLSAKTKSYKSIRIDFAYIMENKKENINDKFTGTLLSKGDKYKLTVAGQDVICDGKTMWTYMKDANEVNINDVDANDDSFTPTKLLTNYTKEYKAKLIEEKGNNQVLELYPLAKGKSFTKVKLTVDKALKQVKEFVIFDRGGSTFKYTVNKFITDQAIDDKTFLFNKANHPGVEVIDMR
ncbi:MAG TPA: outer membrane lipoprotein carrier protein LolA [Bacteroidales bacterium]|nr:outer membrane lipoprotein carrier protein LolA [Bacteroidales bacterium]